MSKAPKQADAWYAANERRFTEKWGWTPPRRTRHEAEGEDRARHRRKPRRRQGIAVTLGEEGATVYVTGRSVGIAVRCDRALGRHLPGAPVSGCTTDQFRLGTLDFPC